MMEKEGVLLFFKYEFINSSLIQNKSLKYKIFIDGLCLKNL